MKLEVISFQDWKKLDLEKKDVVVTVSKSQTWSRGLSPFHIGPCELYDGYIAKNMENAWQFSKVYPEHVEEGIISEDYWEWAKRGWADQEAFRYPMGKGRIPLFSYWNGERLGYIEARKKIYIPVYYRAVKDTEAFDFLQCKYNEYKRKDKNLYLVDFDAYRHQEFGMTFKDVINCEDRKMGHAFVLGMALECPEKLEKAISNTSDSESCDIPTG